MELSGELQATVGSSPEKDYPGLIVHGAGWAPEPVWKSWRKEEHLPPKEIIRTACSYQEFAYVSSSGRMLGYYLKITNVRILPSS
jgi:hypothetical protein